MVCFFLSSLLCCVGVRILYQLVCFLCVVKKPVVYLATVHVRIAAGTNCVLGVVVVTVLIF